MPPPGHGERFPVGLLSPLVLPFLAPLRYNHIPTRRVKVSITVEHEKRKREILEKSLDVFVEEGYEDTTFQKIAERCGITRTILYLYFKNKREIFAFSIKHFTEKLESVVRAIGADESRSQADKLADIIAMVVDTCGRNRRLLAVILDYLEHQRLSGGNPDERVRRRTIRMRHILAGIVIEGQRRGELGSFPVKAASDLVYALIEAAIFRIAVLGRADASGLAESAKLLARGLVAQRPAPRSGGQARR
jgi:AcrR family transcriptional regulator